MIKSKVKSKLTVPYRFLLLLLLIPKLVFAQGLTIPAGSTVDVASSSLNVSGNIDINGTMSVSTGSVSLSGSWNNAGILTAGTGSTVSFTASSGTQTINSGGTTGNQDFYNLTHASAGTLNVASNPIDINGSFTNSAGTVLANGFSMNVGGNWTNAGTFTPGTNTVTFDGTGQTITGDTTFYNFYKVTGSDTMTFAASSEQTITNSLTLQGTGSGTRLVLNSSSPPTRFKVNLQAGAAQSMNFLVVNNSDATGQDLTPSNTIGTGRGNDDLEASPHWVFGSTGFNWEGDVSSNWFTGGNWDLGVVPGDADSVDISDVTGLGWSQPVLTADAHVEALTVENNATMTLDGYALTIDSTFSNDGIMILDGSEATTFTMDNNSGTFRYIGDGDGTAETFTLSNFNGSGYYNLEINDTNATKDKFILNSNLTVHGNLTAASGEFDINSDTLTVEGNIIVNGGTLTGTNGNIDDNGSVITSSGTLAAPGSGKYFAVAGSWAHSGGTFTSNSGNVTFDAPNSMTFSGSTVFYDMTSTGSSRIMFFEAGTTQTFANSLTLTGTPGQEINLRSIISGSQFNLSVAANQTVQALDVKDSNVNGTADIFCVGCLNSGGNDDANPTPHWVFLNNISGVVFESKDNTPITDAQVTLYRASDNVAAVVGVDLHADDTNPHNTVQDGAYSFRPKGGGSYYIRVNAAGYNYPSGVQHFPAGRNVITGSKGETFTSTDRSVIMDLPVDFNGQLLRIEKHANKKEVHVGEVVTYTVTIENIGTKTVNSAMLEDAIPPGFKYIKNRVTLDATPIADPSGNRPLLFNIGDYPPGIKRTLRYQLVVGAGVIPGEYQNSAFARLSQGQRVSNRASETVKVILDPLFDAGTVIGKVFYDRNENGIQDPPTFLPTEQTTIVEDSVPDVRIAMEDGTVITTDKNGQFHMQKLLPGRHLFRLDERTLPEGSYLTTDKVVVLDVTPGSTYKVNFGVNVDNSQLSSEDHVFFTNKVKVLQDQNKIATKLHIALYQDQIPVYDGVFLESVEFRMFTNYAAFIDGWRVEIRDRDTHHVVKTFEGNRFNFTDPIYWDGKDSNGEHIRLDRNYEYVLLVNNKKGNFDETKPQPIAFRTILDEKALKDYFDEQEKLKDKLVENYRKWIEDQEKNNSVLIQTILVQGETVTIDPHSTQLQNIRIMQNGKLYLDVPLAEDHGLTAKELIEGHASQQEPRAVEVILPDGDYDVVVQEQQSDIVDLVPQNERTVDRIEKVKEDVGGTPIHSYTKPIKVGENYLFFVAMGDAKAGYTWTRGNVEPVQQNDQYEHGFWQEGKMAYYLKGKIKGKYLITSSFDTQRNRKELFRNLDPDEYYPVYGDEASINYDATDTQGNLYLLMQWDKSSVQWSNYSVSFGDTDFAKYSRTLYGGKVNFESMSTTPYGEARTKAVLFHARVQQKSAHNEFLATGGSLYYFKHKDITEGSDKVKVQVRDQINGTVISERDMVEGADYDIDYKSGRMLFWLPVPMLVQSYSIVSNEALRGNPIYVVVDYEYNVKDKLDESSLGGRVQQAIGNNVIAGATYVKDSQDKATYELRGTDVTAHLGKNAKVTAEFAQSQSDATGSFVSTDGGLTFSDLTTSDNAKGQAYGIKGDARLFDRVGLTGEYKWVGNDFSSSATTAQQGKEIISLGGTYDLTDHSRLNARYDVQNIIDDGNLQTQAQVGAQHTANTLIQFVHEARKFKMTAAYQRTEVGEKNEKVVSATNKDAQTLAIQADYQFTDKIDLSLTHQKDITGVDKGDITTIALNAAPTDDLRLKLAETLSKEGLMTTFGVEADVNKSAQLTDRVTLLGEYSVIAENNGHIGNASKVGAIVKPTEKTAITTTYGVKTTSAEQTKTVEIGSDTKVSDKSAIQSDLTIGQTITPTGATQSTSAKVGGATQLTKETSLRSDLSMNDNAGQKSANLVVGGTSNIKISENTNVKGDVKMAADSLTGKAATVVLSGTSQVDNKTAVQSDFTISDAAGVGSTTMALKGTQQVDEKTSKEAEFKSTETSGAEQATTFTLGTKRKLTDDLELASSKTFGLTGNDQSETNTYGLARVKDGKKLEGTLSRQLTQNPSQISRSNIFGLNGEIDNHWAMQGSYERGNVQNLNGTQTDRNALSVNVGYANKDEQTGNSLTSSTKMELRSDTGDADKRQYLFYNATEGKINPETTLFTKLEFSKTRNTTSDLTEAAYRELSIGGAYRPISFDRLNLLARYTYKEDKSPKGQVDTANILEERTQVISMDGIYDINDKWQIAERYAIRISDEKVAGFDFTKTHTWLMIHRLNYKIDKDWLIGAEFRTLTQEEAQDVKKGFLVEAARRMGDYAQLGVGYNFTQFNDDLTTLSYTAAGPYVRLTGKFYDQTKEEIERNRKIYLDEKISRWAWVMVQEELSRPDSPILAELNQYFILAKRAHDKGDFIESKQIYKDVITAGQMMFQEAVDYIQGYVSKEEDLQKMQALADEYFKKGEYDKAKKILEKILEAAQQHMVE